MDVIQQARELGKAIQKDERYIRLQEITRKSDQDEDLQNAIREFNEKRNAITVEAAKSDRDEEKIRQMNMEIRVMYDDIMRSENMTAYNEARESFDLLMKRVNAIISLCSEGEDPETADLTEEACGGSCATCPGCH